jgi:hypothetical protein
MNPERNSEQRPSVLRLDSEGVLVERKIILSKNHKNAINSKKETQKPRTLDLLHFAQLTPQLENTRNNKKERKRIIYTNPSPFIHKEKDIHHIYLPLSKSAALTPLNQTILPFSEGRDIRTSEQKRKRIPRLKIGNKAIIAKGSRRQSLILKKLELSVIDGAQRDIFYKQSSDIFSAKKESESEMNSLFQTCKHRRDEYVFILNYHL